MKKLLIILMAVIITTNILAVDRVITYDDRDDKPARGLRTDRFEWKAGGTLSGSTGSALGNDNRNLTYITGSVADANKVVIDFSETDNIKINTCAFRFSQSNSADNGNNDAYTVQMYYSFWDGFIVDRMATLTLTVGQQYIADINDSDFLHYSAGDANEVHLVDTVAASNEHFFGTWSAMGATDQVGYYWGDLLSIDKVIFIWSSVAGAADEKLYIDYCGLN